MFVAGLVVATVESASMSSGLVRSWTPVVPWFGYEHLTRDTKGILRKNLYLMNRLIVELIKVDKKDPECYNMS